VPIIDQLLRGKYLNWLRHFDNEIRLSHGNHGRADRKWSKIYGRKWRQLRRWIDRGSRNGDPCPPDDHPAMRGWWNRNYPNRKVPQEIEHPLHDAENNLSQKKRMLPIEPPIDLASFDPEEGVELRNARRLAASIYNKLENRSPGQKRSLYRLHRQKRAPAIFPGRSRRATARPGRPGIHGRTLRRRTDRRQPRGRMIWRDPTKDPNHYGDAEPLGKHLLANNNLAA